MGMRLADEQLRLISTIPSGSLVRPLRPSVRSRPFASVRSVRSRPPSVVVATWRNIVNFSVTAAATAHVAPLTDANIVRAIVSLGCPLIFFFNLGCLISS